MGFVRYPDPVLAAKAAFQPVDSQLLEIGERLVRAAMESSAYGLAAAHIGEVAPVILLNSSPEAPTASYRLYFNPRVIDVSQESETGKEGSVSLPGVEAEIARPVWAEIAYQDAAGMEYRERLSGFLARCALHEIEQVNGRFFLANLSRLKRDMVLKKAAKRAG